MVRRRLGVACSLHHRPAVCNPWYKAKWYVSLFHASHVLVHRHLTSIFSVGPVTGGQCLEVSGLGFDSGAVPTVRFACGKKVVEAVGECTSGTSISVIAPSFDTVRRSSRDCTSDTLLTATGFLRTSHGAVLHSHCRSGLVL